MTKNITSLEILNRLFLQWFFIRLAKSIGEDGSIIAWKILYPIIPLTGWSTDYKLFLSKKMIAFTIWEKV